MEGVIGGLFVLGAVIFGFVLLILWIVLPFAVFGIRRRLDELIAIQRKLYQFEVSRERGADSAR